MYFFDCDSVHNAKRHSAECHYAECRGAEAEQKNHDELLGVATLLALLDFAVDEFVSGVTDVMGDVEFGVACDAVSVT